MNDLTEVHLAKLLAVCQSAEDVKHLNLRSPALMSFLRSQWQVLPAILDALATAECDTSQSPELLSRKSSIEALARIQNLAIAEISHEFERLGVEFSFLKGTAIRWICYDRPETRSGFDIDLAVRKSDVSKARAIVESLGFCQSVWLEEQRKFVRATISEQRWVENNHYELGYLIRRQVASDLDDIQRTSIESHLAESPNPWHRSNDGRLCVYLNVDIHHGLSHDIPVDDMLESSVVSKGFPVPSNAWTLLHLVFKVYWEGVHSYGKGLYQFADLNRLWPLISKQDFDEFVVLVRALRLEAAAFYVIKRLEVTFSVGLNSYVQDFLSEIRTAPEGATPASQNDQGDMWSRLWGKRFI